MPIRTHRGRAAVYRRFWGAPMRSPKHLAVTLAIIVAAITGIGFVLPQVLGSTEDEPGAERTYGTSTVTTGPHARELPGTEGRGRGPAQTRLTEMPVTPTRAEADPQALDVAVKWAQAWVSHGEHESTEEWLAALEPYTTDEYLPLMRSIATERISATSVTGDPKPTNSFTSSVDVEVPTDGPTLILSVVNTDAGWRVAQYDEAG